MGDVFSKYIEAKVTALFCLLTLRHRCPSYLLLDQGPNVDGQTIKELCEMFYIQKRQSSTYHSQGNGFAERNTRNIREVFHSTLFNSGTQQKLWRSLLPDVVFALNTSTSSTTNHTPYETVFGSKPILLQDLLFDQHSHPNNSDILKPTEYATELIMHLKEAYQRVAQNLGCNRKEMQKQYNKNIRFHDYHVGEKMWLQVK